MKILCLFSVGANCVRPRAFTERPYEDDFLSVVKPALWKAPLRVLLFLPLKAINIAVAPGVITAVMAVEGHPEVARAATHLYGHQRAPTAKSAVVVVEFCLGHAALVIYSVVCALVKVVSADEVKLAVDLDERSARLRAVIACADEFIALERRIRLEEYVSVFSRCGVKAADRHKPFVRFLVIEEIGVLVAAKAQEFRNWCALGRSQIAPTMLFETVP